MSVFYLSLEKFEPKIHHLLFDKEFFDSFLHFATHKFIMVFHSSNFISDPRPLLEWMDNDDNNVNNNDDNNENNNDNNDNNDNNNHNDNHNDTNDTNNTNTST